jgi:hypothetical protein
MLLGLGSGCNKPATSTSTGNETKQAVPSKDPIATIHWIGSKRLATLSNAAKFFKLWSLPETEKLRSQTLDKIALAPWTISLTNNAATNTNSAALVRANPLAASLRPLLDDLVQDEFYLEIRDSGSSSCQLALAVRLDAKRATLWNANLASVFESVTGARRSAAAPGSTNGWSLRSATQNQQPLLRHVELARAGEWTVLGLCPDQSSVFPELLARVQHNQTPGPNLATGDWLQAALDLRRLSSGLSWNFDLPQDWPTVSIGLSGNGSNVVTRGQLKFAKPVPFEIEPWVIPTNLIHEPVHSFAAVQGIKSWLSSSAAWQNLHAGTPPNQLFWWGQSGSPFLYYAAAPVPDPNKTLAKLGPAIVDDQNPLLSSNRMGHWEHSQNSDGIVWKQAPIISPFIQSTNLSDAKFLFSGLSPLAVTETPPPSGTIRDLVNQPGVVYFEREVTGPRVQSWMFLGQLGRIILRRSQLPGESIGVQWLRAIVPDLMNSSTTVIKSSPTELTLNRSSTIGFTAFELHILVDWLESPQFPTRLYTTVSKLPPLPPRRKGTNSPATTTH